jgi:hypothetical protein
MRKIEYVIGKAPIYVGEMKFDLKKKRETKEVIDMAKKKGKGGKKC